MTSPRADVTFIGNATVILHLGPFTVLTDPNFLRAGQRAYLGYGLWSKRLLDPAMEIGQLPDLDAIILSHLHGDHWDRVAEAGLRKDIPVLTTGEAARTLARRGFQTEGLRTWQSFEVTAPGSRLTVTSVPGWHGPGLVSRLLPVVMGTIIDLETEGEPRVRVYISGDTMHRPALREIAVRYPGIDVALVHLGGTKLLGLVTVTMDGRQGTDLMQLIQPRTAIPVHFDDYSVFTSTAEDFEKQMLTRGPAATVVRRVARGQTRGLLARNNG